MRFDLNENGPTLSVEVGDVYPASGPRHTGYWVVASITNATAHCLGIDAHGAIVSTASYGLHALRDRKLVGVAPDVCALNVSIKWKIA